jgi:hypothetical protein
MADDLEDGSSSGGSEELPGTRKKRRLADDGTRRSLAWFMFCDVKGQEEVFAQCLVCKKVLKAAGGTTSGLMKHAESAHLETWLKIKAPRNGKPYRVPGSFNDEALALKEAQTPERDGRAQRLAQLTLIVKCNIPFAACDSWYFKNFAYTCGTDQEPYSRQTIQRDLLATPGDLEPRVRRMLHEADAKVSLTFDIWRSPYGAKYIAFTGHWLTVDFEPRGIILWFEEVAESHPSTVIAEHLQSMLDKWELSPSQLGTMTSDNAHENILMMREFSARTGWDAEFIVRCCCHSMQLAVNQLLEAPEVAALIRKASKQHRYINGSGGGRVKWFEDQCRRMGLQVYRMQPINATRWHSALNLLQDILPNPGSEDDTWLTLLQSFNTKYLVNKNGSPNERKMGKVAWLRRDFDRIRDVRLLLEPFKLTMLGCEASDKPTLPCAADHYEVLMDGLADEQVPVWLQPMAKKMHDKLLEYYKKTGSVFYMATALDPCFKLSLYAGEPREGHATYEEIRGQALRGYLPYFDAPPPTQPPVPATPPPSRNRRLQREDPERPSPVQSLLSRRAEDITREVHAQMAHRDRVQAMRPEPEEITRYLVDPLAIQGTNVLTWWRENKKSYPTLAKAARDILAGQASSAAVERVFSHGGDLISDKRNRLAPETVKAWMLLHSWLDFVRTGFK